MNSMNSLCDESASELLGNLRHEFVIGPLRDHPLFKSKARQYYCTRCNWTCLVCGTRVVVLDESMRALAVDEGTKRFSTFEIDPCPVLEALAAEAFGALRNGQANESESSPNESRHSALNDGSSRAGGLGSLLRILTRLGGGLAGC